MQILQNCSRIKTLLPRSLYGYSGETASPLQPGRYVMAYLKGGVAFEDNHLVNSIKHLPARLNFQKVGCLFIIQVDSVKKWVKFTETGNELVDESQATKFLVSTFDTTIGDIKASIFTTTKLLTPLALKVGDNGYESQLFIKKYEKGALPDATPFALTTI